MHESCEEAGGGCVAGEGSEVVWRASPRVVEAIGGAGEFLLDEASVACGSAAHAAPRRQSPESSATARSWQKAPLRDARRAGFGLWTQPWAKAQLRSKRDMWRRFANVPTSLPRVYVISARSFFSARRCAV